MQGLDEQPVEALEKLEKPPGRLYEVRLPRGDVGSINIDWFRNGASVNLSSSEWLGQGYAGVRFIGDGTQIRCDSWDGTTVSVGRHAGIVSFENVTIWPGYAMGVRLGEQNFTGSVVPEFQFRFVNSELLTSPEGPRAKWGIFSYNCDLLYKDCRFDGRFLNEHDSYAHGFAKLGARVIRTKFDSAGAECFKVRPDRSETAPVDGVPLVEFDNCTFKDWYQDWSWRGGAAIVLQSSSSNLRIHDCLFYPGAGTASVPGHLRSRCVMVTSEANSYPVIAQGSSGQLFGNGYIIIRRSGFGGQKGPDWGSTLIRVGQNSGEYLAARAFLMEDCGAWGENLLVQLGQIPVGKVRISGCNTPEIRQRSQDLGLDATHEVRVPTSTRLVPLSSGWAA